jgi:hypothetical protein
VADSVFYFGRQFGKGLIVSVGSKNRIVAETVFATRWIDDYATDYSFESAKQFAAARQREHAAKAR